LYGHETWSFTLREEHRLRVFELKRGEVAGGLRKLCNKEPCSSINICRMTKPRNMRRVGHVSAWNR